MWYLKYDYTLFCIYTLYLLGKCKVLCVDEKTILLPMCDEIFCSIKITAAMNWTFQCTGPFVIFDASLRGHKLNWMNFTWWSVWDGKKIEQSNSPAACEKVESVQKKNVHSRHYSAIILSITKLQILFQFQARKKKGPCIGKPKNNFQCCSKRNIQTLLINDMCILFSWTDFTNPSWPLTFGFAPFSPLIMASHDLKCGNSCFHD